MTTIATRNLFIDTEISQSASSTGQSFRLNVPPSSFSCKPNQIMKMTLTNWEMRKNWYEVNQTNNVFWMKVTLSGVSKYFPCVIPPGSYRAFGTTNTAPNTIVFNSAYSYANNDLCSAIAYAVQKTLASLYTNSVITDSTGAANVYTAVTGYTANAWFSAAPTTTVAFNTVTRKFTITVPAPSTNYSINSLIFLQCKNGIPATHPMATFIGNFNSAVFGDPIFQDSYELLGAIPTRDTDIAAGGVVTATNNNFNTNVFVSPYVGQLNTLEAIYMRLVSASTNNFQSPGLDRNVANNYSLVPTNIFARIPLPAAVYDDSIELLSYSEQGGSTFSCLIDARQMQIFEFSFTDDKGRPIQEVLAGQAKSGNLSSKVTIKWEIIQYDQSLNSVPASLDIIKSLASTGFVRPNDDLMPPSNDREVRLKKKTARSAFQPTMSLLNH